MGFIYRTIREYMISEGHLSYDEIDTDGFTNRYIVGRFFESEEDANDYLESIIHKSDDKTIKDFLIVKDDSDTSLKPYRIYPTPTDMEIKRNKASKFIQKYGILSTKDLRYITYPLYAYLDYRYINKIKEFGISYQFKPIDTINLDGPLSRFMKENGHINNIIGGELKLYNYSNFDVIDENSISLSEVSKIRNDIQILLDEFNNIVGTDYFISKDKLEETSNSLKRGINNLLKDDDYSSEYYSSEYDKKYKRVSFIIERGDDEKEFLAIVDMESIDKPKMKSE